MRKYIKKINMLKIKDSVFTSNNNHLLILSGQSNYEHSELSKEQSEMLEKLNNKEFTTIDIGFPFNKKHRALNNKRTAILLASLRNFEQFFWMTFVKSYKKIIARNLQPVFNLSNKVIIICQSSGLNMLKYTLPYINIKKSTEIIIIALGPIVFGRFNYPYKTYIIKGNNDIFSRLLDYNKVNYWVNCHHLTYVNNFKVLNIIKSIIENEN